MKLTKEVILRHALIFFSILSVLSVSYLGGLIFFIGSIIFFSLGGLFEFVVMNWFFGDGKENLSDKDSLKQKFSNSILWVHNIIGFRKRYNKTIYNTEQVGVLLGVLPYIIMLLYVIVSRFAYDSFSYYGFLVYLIPALSNVYFFARHAYIIADVRRH